MLSTQHDPDIALKDLREAVIETIIKPTIPAKYIDKDTKFFVNPTGRFVVGGLCAYPVAIFLMGQSAAEIAFYAYIVPFLISTAAGAIIAGALIYCLKQAGALSTMQERLSQ